MKSKAVLYALVIVVLDLIAAVNVVKANTDNSGKEYASAVSRAEELEGQNLCYKAITEYSKACEIKDSSELRLKIADLYEEGYKNGEFANLSGMLDTLAEITELYPQESAAYDKLIGYYFGSEEYSSCAEYVRLARTNGIDTETVNSAYEDLRHRYSEQAAGYDEVQWCGSYYALKKEVTDEQSVLSEDGTPVIETDENGKETVKTEEVTYNEYAYIYSDGEMSEPYKAVEMSPLGSVYFGEGDNEEVYSAYYIENYGRNIDARLEQNKIYSSVVIDGVRENYIGDEGGDYNSAGSFGNNYITLYNNKTNKYDIFDHTGTKVYDSYDYAGVFANNVMLAEKNGTKGIMSTDGSFVMENVDDAVTTFGNRCSYFNRMFVKRGGSRFKMINTEDFSEIGFECDNADLFLDGAAAYEDGGKWGFVAYDGTVMIEPQYEEAKSFSCGLAAVKKDGRWGFINDRNEMIIEPAFEDALYFIEDASACVYTEENGWDRISLFYAE